MLSVPQTTGRSTISFIYFLVFSILPNGTAHPRSRCGLSGDHTGICLETKGAKPRVLTPYYSIYISHPIQMWLPKKKTVKEKNEEKNDLYTVYRSVNLTYWIITWCVGILCFPLHKDISITNKCRKGTYLWRKLYKNSGSKLKVSQGSPPDPLT